MTPKECFEKWDAQYVTHGGADYKQMIEDIERLMNHTMWLLLANMIWLLQ